MEISGIEPVQQIPFSARNAVKSHQNGRSCCRIWHFQDPILVCWTGSIRDFIQTGRYRFSEHAVKRMIKREIDRQEIEEAILSGEIIEKHPGDKYSPSCLVFGVTASTRHLHVQVSLPPDVVVITAYEPSPEAWIGSRIRR